jgi:hypothetical protein
MTAAAALRSHPRVVIPVAAVFVLATIALFNTRPAGPAIPVKGAGISIEQIQRAADIKALPVALVYDFF